LKIIFITHYSKFYGANKSLYILIKGLKDKGIEVLLVAPHSGEFTKKLEEDGFKIKLINHVGFVYERYLSYLKFPFKLIINLIFLYKLYLLHKKEKFDLVYSNSSIVSVGVIFSKMFQVPHIWHIREYGKMDYNVTYYFSPSFKRCLLKKSNLNIAISKSIKKTVLDNRNNSVVIYNGVQLSDEYSKTREIDENINFAIIGLINHNKNQLEAIEAFKLFNEKIRNSKLYIIGDTNDKKYYHQIRSISSSNENIIFTGFLSNVEEFIDNSINILLMCSKYEAFGRVTIEAMNLGIPVIGKSSGGTKEILQETGVLYEGDVKDLYNKMIYLVSDPSNYKAISSKSIQEVKNKYTDEHYINNVLSEIIKVYNEQC